MTEVPIIIKHTVNCVLFNTSLLLTMCRICKHYRHETVDGFVICNYIPKKKKGVEDEI